MFKQMFRLPSPAIVISMIALALVLGGTAVAAGTANDPDAKADTALVKKLAPKLSVKHAKTAGDANTVGGYAANQLTRGAATHVDSSIPDGNLKTIASVTLTVPRSGFVLVNAATDTDGCACQLSTQLSEGSDSSYFVSAEVPASGEAGTANTFLFPVTVSGPTPETFKLTGWRYSGSGTLTTDTDMTALFVPFGATGTSTGAPRLASHRRSTPGLTN